MAAARDALRAAAGDDAVVEAAATAANFALFTRVVDATGHTDPMMELQKRGPSARTWLAIAAALAIVAVGVRFVLCVGCEESGVRPAVTERGKSWRRQEPRSREEVVRRPRVRVLRLFKSTINTM